MALRVSDDRPIDLNHPCIQFASELEAFLTARVVRKDEGVTTVQPRSEDGAGE
jgi:hypothetical protein